MESDIVKTSLGKLVERPMNIKFKYITTMFAINSLKQQLNSTELTKKIGRVVQFDVMK